MKKSRNPHSPLLSPKHPVKDKTEVQGLKQSFDTHIPDNLATKSRYQPKHQIHENLPVSDPPPLPPKGPVIQNPNVPPEIPRKPVKLPSPKPSSRRQRPPPYKSVSQIQALQECVKNVQFPVMIRVASGRYDYLEERKTIPTDQEFVALFKKRTKVVRAKPEDYMRMYSIPINSAIKFIPLYEEDSRFDKASWEGDFDNVADLHKLDKLPKVLAVTRDIFDSDRKPIKSGTYLFQLQKKVKRKGERGIKAVDHLGKKHSFFENERVSFSSRRDHIKMFVYEFSKFMTFPVKVQARVPVEVENLMRAEALGSEPFIEDFSILNFEKLEDETTIVVYMDIANLNLSLTSMEYIMEIPTDIEIDVQIIEFEEERNQKEMYEAVVHFYEILGSGNQSCDNPYSSSGQRILNSNVDNTYECATELDDIDHIYDYISFIPNMIQGESNLQKTKPVHSAKELPLPRPPKEEPPKLPQPRKEEPPMLPQPRKEELPMLPQPRKEQLTVEPLVQAPSIPKSPKIDKGEDSHRQYNKEYLRGLNHIKVLELLDLMDLGKYRENFMREHIDGEVLVDLGEEELKDLGVVSRLHILRFKKIIEGETPAQKYLEEGNPYKI